MPPAGTWADYAAQSMIHAFVAALATEALIRLWRARAPRDRLALRLLGLGQPLLVTPLLVLLLPGRAADEFNDRWALFTSRRWEDVAFRGVSAFTLLVALFAATGVALFLGDLLPLLRRLGRALPPAAEPPARLRAALRDAAASLGAPTPPLHHLELRAPVLFCAGVRRPRVVVSAGALELLDDGELRAALAHELAHLVRRDPAVSWTLMAARALLFFNPAVQVVARAVAREAEWCADERAGGDRLALASAVVKLYRAGQARPAPVRRTLPFAAALGEPFRRARFLDVEARCRRLMEPSDPPRLAFRGARAVLAAASLAAIAGLVT